jgi:hypothetical protein
MNACHGESKRCTKHLNRMRVLYPIGQFQHFGIQSSLNGKKQKIIVNFSDHHETVDLDFKFVDEKMISMIEE